ncbi:uncharacterized protein LOC121049030 [Rosa chinensis]|uniref:uncharacterized protein LOC121049030 n=1 Tax=Rosa chinensis TaxID=74649 RepID=UPI001AD8D89D|nr:uncharacterized protein LOC121049030 [Rosa chinensis]
MKFNMLLNFLGLLRKSHKLFFRNGKAVSSMTLLIILVRSFLLVINFYTLKPIITGFAIKARFLATTSPRGAEFADLVTAANLSLSISSIILWKRLVHQGTSTKGTEVIEKTICTWFYITLLDLGIVAKAIPVKAVIIPLLLLNCISCLIAMVSRMAYTVLYYESKATHGEELERTARKLGHAKVTSDTPLINADAI